MKNVDDILSKVDSTMNPKEMSLYQAKEFLEELLFEIKIRLDGIEEDIENE